VGRADFVEAAGLLGRYCDGDEVAFHRLYALLAPRILGYLLGLAGERALAEDLLQQTFLKLHQSRSLYVRQANPTPWLYTIAHRSCLDEWRSCLDEWRRKKRSPMTLTPDGTLPEATDDMSLRGGPPTETGHEEAPRVGLAELDGLPLNQREALMLTKVHGHSVAEAARIAGTTPGAIKLRAHRAYVTLRQRFAQQDTKTTEVP
jgi:RNA polymerase sigma-70 factor (ECF subfamily)